MRIKAAATSLNLQPRPLQKADRRGVLPPGILLVTAVLLIGGWFGPNSFLTSISATVLIGGAILTWRPGEPPVLLLGFLFGWLGASIPIFHASFANLTVAQNAEFAGEPELAVLLSQLGLLAVALGARTGLGRWTSHPAQLCNALANAMPIEAWARLYGLSLIGSFVASGSIYAISGLAQLMIGLINLKWAFFYMFAYATFLQRRTFPYLFAGVFLLEFAIAFGGFFSDFKTVFLVTILAAIAAGTRVTVGRALAIGLLSAALLLQSIVWSAIKIEYRQFVSGEHAAQIVSVNFETRTRKLIELIGQIDEEKFAKGTDLFLRRIGYTDIFGAAIGYVPNFRDHENGAIMLDAITRPFMPRIFFPDKTVIDDTARTNEFTGGVAGNYEATSISLGYIAETYIDFGIYGMFPALYLIGLSYGLLYRWLITMPGASTLLGTGIAVSALWNVMLLENSFTKVAGGVIISTLSALLVVAVILPSVCPWLKRNPPG